MATGRGTDCDGGLGLCLGALTHSNMIFNTVGMGGIVLIKCVALNRRLDSNLMGLLLSVSVD